MTEKTLNIYQRINEVRKQVEYVTKDGSIGGYKDKTTGIITNAKYKGVTHDQVTAHIHDSCVEQGIMIVPSQINGETVDTGTKTSSGTPIIRYQASYNVSFINIDNPKDKFTANISSHANDTGDKAPGKALSYAVKSIELKIFMLETGENDESRVEGARREKVKISPDQVEWINKKVKEYKIDEDGFNSFLKKNRVKDIESINVNFFPTIEQMINQKGAQNVK